MHVYFVRHGESEANMSMIRQGPDEPLSRMGIMQAKALAKRVTNIPADVIFSSTYRRAEETAAYIQTALGKAATNTPLFRELQPPSELVGLPLHGEESIRAYELKHMHEHEPDWHLSDEENFYDAKTRAKEALRFLEDLPFQHTIVVTHSQLMLHIAALILLPETISLSAQRQFMQHMQISNTGISTCEFLGETKGWRLVTWNDNSHLIK